MNSLLFLLQITCALGATSTLLSLGKHYPRWTSLLGPALLGLTACFVAATLVGLDPRIAFTVPSSSDEYGNNPNTSKLSPVIDKSQKQTDASQADDSNSRRAKGSAPSVPKGPTLQQLKQFLFRHADSTTHTNFSSGVARFTWLTILSSALFYSARFLIGTLQVEELCRTCKRSNPIGELLSQTIPESNGKDADIWVGDRVTSPFVVWQHPNRIYLPESFETFSRDDQVAVLAHESVHLKRKDPGVRLFVDCTMTLLCWHPLAWRVRRQIEEAQELAADFEAATLLGDLTQYRRALSHWLLWMDKQPWMGVPYCVTFTTNTGVRRIQMLKRITGTTVSKRFVVLSAMLISVGVLCSGWKLQADDKTKLASVRISKSTENDQAKFAGPKSTPWKTIGDRKGYYRVRSGEFTKSPFVQNLFLASTIGYTKNASQEIVAELFGKFESVEGNLLPQAKRLPLEETQKTGNEHQFMFGASAFNFEFNDSIDWSSFASILNFEAILGSPDYSEWADDIQSEIRNTGDSKILAIGLTKPPHFAETLAHQPALDSRTKRLAALWSLVEGGQVTLAAENPMTSELLEPTTDKERGPIAQVGRALAGQVDLIAAGADCGDSIFHQDVRIAAFPRNIPAEKLVELVVSLRDQTLDVHKSAAEAGDEPEDYLAAQRHRWETMQTEVVPTQEGDAVYVTFQNVFYMLPPGAESTENDAPGKRLPTIEGNVSVSSEKTSEALKSK